MNNKYYDTTAALQVIGAVFNNPSLLEEADKYVVVDEDFGKNDFHKIVFGSIFKLWESGAKEITIANICDYLENKPQSYATFITNKGEEWLRQASEAVTPNAFDYYYQRLKKMTLLRTYDNYGVDVTFIYDPDLLDTKKLQLQEEQLDNLSLEEIAEKVDSIIEGIKLKCVGNTFGEAAQAGEGIDDLIDSLMLYPEVGVPLYGKFINRITRGARLRKLYLRSAATGVGKALPNSTVIPTPNGDKKVGEIKSGDYIFDAFGEPTLVRAIYPQGEKEVWEVTFKDGRKARCCEEHLWSYCTEGQRKEAKEGRKFYTDTLKDISKKELYQQGHGYKILVPMQKAVKYEEKKYYIKPYSFGLLLGDGSFRYNKGQKALSYSSENEILPSKIADEMNWDYKKSSDFNYSWTFEWKNESTHKKVWVEEALKEYPALWNTKSEDKYIPNEYLRGSISQRFDLLNGLLDSDGSIDKETGRISYYTISSKLKDGVIELARSLGFKTSVIEDSHKDTHVCYKIEISGQPEDKIKLFKLNRKKELVLQWYSNGKRKENNLFNPIIEIKKLNYSEEMTCFYVDNEEHLFLMNDYIVTHNTRSLIADCCYIGSEKIYDPMLGWISNGVAEPTLFIATEQDLQEVQTMMLAFLSCVNEEHILNNSYTGDELDRVREAARILKESPIYVELLPDFSIKDIENTIKKNIRDYGVKYCFMDYIHTSMKILEEVSRRSGGVKLREDNVLFMLAIKLKDICNQNGIFIETATQLNASYQESETPDQNLLRGAKSIADKIDLGSILLSVTNTDLEKLNSLLVDNGLETPTIKLSVYKNRRGQYKGIYLWCKANLGTCRIDPMFVTDWRYQLLEVNDLKIEVAKGAF